MNRLFLFILVSFFLILAAPSCAPDAEPEKTAPRPVDASITVVDAAGRTVTLQSFPKRIVVVGQAPFIPLHMLYLFPEARERLVGYERKVKKDDAFLALVDPGFKQKVIVEGSPSAMAGPEQIAALKPDLVITKGRVESALSRSLAVLHIPVVYLGAEDPDLFLADIEILGKLFGDAPRARQITEYYRGILDTVARGIAPVPESERPRVLVLEYSNRGGSVSVLAPSKDWFQTAQAKLAGGRPVWLDHLPQQQGFQIVDFEQVAAWNPQKIFVIAWFQLSGQEVYDALRQDKKWRMLDAVRKEELYIFPEDVFSWDTAEPRWILGVLWLASKTHPARFGKIDIPAEVYRFFNVLYGLPRSTIEQQIMPKLRLDGRG